MFLIPIFSHLDMGLGGSMGTVKRKSSDIIFVVCVGYFLLFSFAIPCSRCYSKFPFECDA